MKNRPRQRLLPLVLAAVISLLLPACGDEGNPVDPKDRVCGGESGFAARVAGGPKRVDVCVDNKDVSVVLTSGNNYSIRATMTSGGSVYEFQLLVPNRDDFPVILTIHDDFATATLDDRGVWIFYQEIPAEGDALESYEIAPDKGTFTLSFSDGNVMTATFSDISFKLQTQGDNPEDRGTRVVESGFMSLSVDQ
jgi:hypothetical protein